MTNLSRKKQMIRRHKQKGAAVLLTSVILMAIITLVVLFSANFSRTQQKITSNQYKNSQAYMAAEAGLEFAIPYLQTNRSTILANPNGGYIQPYSDSNTQNVTLADNAKYTITYTNPIANNYNLIKVTSTGQSDDGTATRTVSQLVQFGSLLATTPSSSLTTKGSIAMSGSSQVINTETNANIQSGAGTTIQGSAHTTTNSGTSSTSGGLQGDVQQNVSSLANISSTDLFANYFGVSPTTFKNNVNLYYSNSSDANYNSSLNGVTGKTIWIEQTGGDAVISSTTTIGSASAPVILIINGNLRLSGNPVIYGLVYVIGGTSTDVLGSTQIIGGLVTTGNLSLAGNTQITFNSSVLNSTQQTLTYYAKVSGSWKDY